MLYLYLLLDLKKVEKWQSNHRYIDFVPKKTPAQVFKANLAKSHEVPAHAPKSLLLNEMTLNQFVSRAALG